MQSSSCSQPAAVDVQAFCESLDGLSNLGGRQPGIRVFEAKKDSGVQRLGPSLILPWFVSHQWYVDISDSAGPSKQLTIL